MRLIVIVGAGISGLSLAVRLRERLPDADIRILESNDRPGGTAWTERRDGWSVELGPNGFLDNKPTTLKLARDVGLGARLTQASPAAGTNRYLVLDRRLERLPGGPGDLLTTPLLSWRGKLSLLGERFRRGKSDDADESIDAFARRRAGGEIADTFADGLVTGIYAGDPKLLSLPACFPRVAEMERRHGSVMKGFAAAAKERRRAAAAKGEPPPGRATMWSIAGGMRTLVETLAGRCPVTLGVGIRSIRKGGDPRRPTWTVIGDGRDAWDADVVILTCPANRQAEMVADLDGDLGREIGDIPYNQIAVLALGYRRQDVPHSLDGFGFIVRSRRADTAHPAIAEPDRDVRISPISRRPASGHATISAPRARRPRARDRGDRVQPDRGRRARLSPPGCAAFARRLPRLHRCRSGCGAMCSASSGARRSSRTGRSDGMVLPARCAAAGTGPTW